VFIYIALCWVIVALTLAIFGPRTGKVSLEDLNERRQGHDKADASLGSRTEPTDNRVA